MSTFFAAKEKEMKLPPHGKNLYELQLKNQYPKNSVYLYIGKNAWNKASSFLKCAPDRTMVLPAWHSPNYYYWPVQECDILIWDTSFAEDEYIYELAECLYQYRAKIVRYMSSDFILSVYYKEM
jgi:hypothetical protein